MKRWDYLVCYKVIQIITTIFCDLNQRGNDKTALNIFVVTQSTPTTIGTSMDQSLCFEKVSWAQGCLSWYQQFPVWQLIRVYSLCINKPFIELKKFFWEIIDSLSKSITFTSQYVKTCWWKSFCVKLGFLSDLYLADL